jgi:hypothetical protein
MTGHRSHYLDLILGAKINRWKKMRDYLNNGASPTAVRTGVTDGRHLHVALWQAQSDCQFGRLCLDQALAALKREYRSLV